VRVAALAALALGAPCVAAQERPVAEEAFSIVLRGVPLDEALEEIVRLADIDLIYNASLIGEQRVYCARRGASAEELLRCVLHGTGLDFVRSSSGAYVLLEARRQRPPPARLAGRVVDA
jgi:hypothetical protein